jgi:hypothetical protein
LKIACPKKTFGSLKYRQGLFEILSDAICGIINIFISKKLLSPNYQNLLFGRQCMGQK